MGRSLITCTCLQVFLALMLVQLIACDCVFPKQYPKRDKVIFLYKNETDDQLDFAPEFYVLRFRCYYRGYRLIENRFMQCINGEWDGVIPKCQKLQCSDPPVVGNATYELRGVVNGSLHRGSSVNYTCNFGYEFNDTISSPILHCVLERRSNRVKWRGNVPFCKEKKRCPDPGVSIDGKREGSCCISGSVLQFSCNENFELVGNDTIRCLSNGSWSSGRPLCTPLEDHCDFPPAIPHGIVTGEEDGDYFMPDTEAEILCDPGYKYTGPSEFVLCDEGEWEEEFGECTEIFCDPPPQLGNGNILELQEMNLTSFPYNFEITYVCDEGYRLFGRYSWRTCGKNGWSGRTPHCKVIDCPDPGIPENGMRMGGRFEFGAKVHFKCFTGYYLLGSFERYCMPNGQWSGELTSCHLPSDYCPNPETPINGFKNSNRYDRGDKVGFHCQPGYFLLGSEVRECLEDRTWSGTQTMCKGQYDFDNSAQISEILKTKVSENFEEEQKARKRHLQDLPSWYNKAEILSPFDNDMLVIYFLFDVSGSVGSHNFKKSIEFAKAIVKQVGISEDRVRAGALTFTWQAEIKFLPSHFQTTEDVLKALDEIEFTGGGGTTANSALRYIREENIPLDDERFEKKNKKTVIFILTDGKANMGGSPVYEANLLKDLGAEIYCIGITGDVRIQTLYGIASSSKDTKEERPNVFILKNYEALSWLAQDITNGTIDYSQCGLGVARLGNLQLPKILNPNYSTEPWPWMASLYFVAEGGRVDRAKLLCGGSVIHRSFILTSAHCMYVITKEGNVVRMRTKKEIIVKLGLLDVKHETYVQEFEVEEMYMHKDYRPGPFFDYDIALLKLNRPIQYSRFIRPICLPPKELPQESFLYSSMDSGMAIAWGHEGIVERNKNVLKHSRYLKEILLPLHPREICLKSMQHRTLAKYFTDRMFCAGDGQRGDDTCGGNSGSPLIQSQMNSEGYVYWTQVGFVSWSFGCGLENKYGYYTHVQSFRSWIDETIKKAK